MMIMLVRQGEKCRDTVEVRKSIDIPEENNAKI